MCRELPGLCTLAQVQQKLSLGLQQCNTQINKSARKRPDRGSALAALQERLIQTLRSCRQLQDRVYPGNPGCSVLLHPSWQQPSASPTDTLPTPRLPIRRGKRHRQRLRADLGRGILLLCGFNGFDQENMINEGRGEPLACPKPWLKVHPRLVESWGWWGQTPAVPKLQEQD